MRNLKRARTSSGFSIAVVIMFISACSGCGDDNGDPATDPDSGGSSADSGTVDMEFVDVGSDAGETGDAGSDAGEDVPVDFSLEMSPTARDFGTTVIGTTTSAVEFTIVNTGSSSGELAAALTGADAVEFEVTNDGCSAATLEPNGVCVMTLRFSPNTTGSKSANLVVSSGAAEATAELTGEAIADDVAPVLQPGAWDFGSEVVGATTMATSFVLENTGGAESGVVTTNGLNGADASEFNIVSDTCDGNTIAPGGDCAIDVNFAPTSIGAKAASLDVTVDQAGSGSASLAGRGTAFGGLMIMPTSYNFGTTSGTSAPATFTVTNTGSADTGPVSVGFGGAHFGQFSLVANTCQGALAPGEMCVVRVVFAPTSAGTKTATVGVSANPGGSATADLEGTGAVPVTVAVSPTAHDFGTIAATTMSAPVTFTVTNTGAQTTGVPNVGLSGAAFPEFTIVTNGCVAPLAPMTSCNVDVAFAPMTPGTYSAQLDVSATPGGTVSATLDGVGQ